MGLFLAAASVPVQAQATSPARPAATVRITQAVNESSLVTLKGNVYPSANAKNDRGPASPSLPMPDLTLVLSRSPERQAAFDAFVSSQYDPNSPNYHHWLLPAEVGEEFGPAPSDIATISNWLTGQGFTITKIAPDGMSIRFSGTAAQVERSFHTQIDNLSVNGVAHIGNMSDPQIPSALAPVVVGVKALHNFLPRPLHKMGSQVEFNQEAGKWQRIVHSTSSPATAAGPESAAKSFATSSPRPQFGVNVPANPTSGSSAYLEEDVTPYDFATIYNVLPLWNAGVDGTGQTIAIAGTSKINLADVATFRSAFGLPAGLTPEQIDTNGLATECTSTSPTAACGIGDLEENSIDVEWAGAVAPKAQVVLVVTGQNTAGTVDAVFDSAEYVVDNLTAKILSVSYGECELGQGTAGNVAFYNLWQSAAAEGISVFVASGDAGSPACDDNISQSTGNPYSAQFGLAVNGLASTPFDTAVGGTDFSWCKPTLDSKGNIQGCPTSSTLQGTPAYWNTSNNSSNGASAANYIPEIAWNDTCTNPILASYLESVAPLVGETTPTNAEGACNFVQNNWQSIYQNYQTMLAPFVDTIGGGGGASNCVSNDGQNVTSCNSATTTGTSYGSIPLTNDGWQKPSWQAGVTGIPNDGVRDLPDVSFFAGDGTLSSAYLFCVSQAGSCSYSSTSQNTAQEAGGTSFGAPAMAGVMALINQKSGAAQGNPDPQLYELGGEQTYSSCSAESVKTSNACYFNDVNQGTIAMACDLGATIGGATYNQGWQIGQPTPGATSPNCTALNTGDQVGTLTTSNKTPAYDAVAGFDLATGLGSLNVANVVNAWTSDAGTGTATMQVSLSATTIAANTPLTVTVTVTGTSPAGTPTGPVVVAGGGYSKSQALTAGAATITIPGNSLSPGSDKLTVTYHGDSTYASISQSVNITVSAIAPTVAVTATPNPQNVANPLAVSVMVSGPAGSPIPTGTVSLASGSYASAAAPLSSNGAANFNISPNALAVGNDTLTATYSGDPSYTAATGSSTVSIIGTALTTPTVTVTPASSKVNIGQSLNVTATVSGPPADTIPTGTATLTAGSYTSPAMPLRTDGSASFAIPSNSLTAGTATIKVAYSGNAFYSVATGSANVTVAQSTYTLTATPPAAVSVGGSTTTTVSVTSSTGYNGTITLSCAETAGPANAVNPPTCTAGSTITMANGTASGTATLNIATTSASAMLHLAPESKGLGGRRWLGAGGAALALVVFLGIPARRRSWRSMLGALVLLITLGSLSACGGGGGGSGSNGSGNGGGGSGGTTLGTYTMTVSAQGNDPANTTASTTFTVVVN